MKGSWQKQKPKQKAGGRAFECEEECGREREREREKKSRWNETKIERVMGLAEGTFFQISISIGK